MNSASRTKELSLKANKAEEQIKLSLPFTIDLREWAKTFSSIFMTLSTVLVKCGTLLKRAATLPVTFGALPYCYLVN
jgi:hypothetical protein